MATLPDAAAVEEPPELQFAVEDAVAAPHAAAPTVIVRLRIEAAGAEVRSILLTTQVRIAVDRRRHDPATRERLRDLFGAPEGWSRAARSLLWTQVVSVVPSFAGTTTIDLPLAATYDLDVASAKYLHGVRDGAVPLELLFSGTVFYAAAGFLRTALLPWDREARFDMPAAVWSAAMQASFPGYGWVRLANDTLDRLRAFKGERALPTSDAAVQALLAENDGSRR